MVPNPSHRRLRLVLTATAAVLFALLAPGRAAAQGCVAVKMNVPVLGSQSEFNEDQRWQVSVGYRWFRSDRHFIGTDEQENRAEEGSQVINNVNLWDLGVQYQVNKRWNLQLALPFQSITRSNPIRDENRVVIGRTKTGATGIGDLLVTAHRWMLDPARHSNGNLRLGFGIKLPTGAYNVLDTRARYCEIGDTDCPPGVSAGELYPSVEHVDQSIMPGDGGTGIVLDLEGYVSFAHDKVAYYGSATYIISPEGENGVTRGRSATSTNSITDFYVARTGFYFSVPGTGLGITVGARFEGVPWDDLWGSNAGFRRPGYVLSIEPGLTWTHGSHGVTFAAPWALVRNRLKSESDRERGRHGDAAFADFSLLASYFLRF